MQITTIKIIIFLLLFAICYSTIGENAEEALKDVKNPQKLKDKSFLKKFCPIEIW